MNKISCDICLDLMPLVWDEVASEDSKDAVLAHIEGCESCRAAFEKHDCLPSPDDKKLLRNFRRYQICCSVLLMLYGAAVGVSFSESENLFYNILIMPAIGAVGVLAMGKKGLLSPLLPAAIFFVRAFFQLARGYVEEGAMMTALFWSLLYGAFCLAGALAMMLFRYAFGKERKDEKN